jgi:hypothetical protein
MEQHDIQEWREFCEGTKLYEPEHFSRLFMELFLEPLSDADQDALRTVFSYVPNSETALEKFLRMDTCADDKSTEEIITLVKRDLYEMRRVVHSRSVLHAINGSAVKIVDSEARFQKACDSDLNRDFFHDLADYFVRAMAEHNGVIRALSNAFFGIASNVHLQWALTADLLGVGESFDNYFELYLIGVDYALEPGSVVVINYRAKGGT